MLHLQQCIVIGIETGSERFSRVQLFSEESGYQQVLKRKSSKQAGIQHLDLFQTVEVVFEQKPTYEMAFLKETHILADRDRIGKNYSAFENASRFCRAIHLNARHMENPKTIYELLVQCLDAWNSKPNPHTIFLKALFRLAAEEGFPVRELWLSEMNPDDRTQTRIILSEPLDTLKIPDSVSKVLADQLINWLTHRQDFLF